MLQRTEPLKFHWIGKNLSFHGIYFLQIGSHTSYQSVCSSCCCLLTRPSCRKPARLWTSVMPCRRERWATPCRLGYDMEGGSWDGLEVGPWRYIVSHAGWKKPKNQKQFPIFINKEKNSLARSRGVYWIMATHTGTHPHISRITATTAAITLLSL